MIRGPTQNQGHLLTREYWGPIFWKLFHSLAEYSGSFKDVVRNDDELFAWTNIMKYQHEICRVRYVAIIFVTTCANTPFLL
jgi:hypothetical protein